MRELVRTSGPTNSKKINPCTFLWYCRSCVVLGMKIVPKSVKMATKSFGVGKQEIGMKEHPTELS